jgi:cob(I)alamin adenosyltransferase
VSFRINRVYTRSGDDGKTALVGGKRVGKSHLRVTSYGDIDELNSVLGLVKERLSPRTEELKEVIEYLQQELFDLGSELATPPSAHYPQMLKISSDQVAQLERACDSYGEGLEELTSFILPGGSEVAALLHLARTVCRRAERSIVLLSEDKDPESSVSGEVVKYINRLSDLLFMVARWALKAEGKTTPLWVKGGQAVPARFKR